MNVVNFLEFKAKRIKMVKCKTQFIQCEDGTVYVPRPNGWMQGMARQIWIERLLKQKPTIASPDYWRTLAKDNPVRELIEYVNGEVEVANESR